MAVLLIAVGILFPVVVVAALLVSEPGARPGSNEERGWGWYSGGRQW